MLFATIICKQFNAGIPFAYLKIIQKASPSDLPQIKKCFIQRYLAEIHQTLIQWGPKNRTFNNERFIEDNYKTVRNKYVLVKD